MKSKKPKFSIIIPAHNEEDVIGRAIESVLDQTFQNFEIIISNDGSTDKTRKIVEKLVKKDKRIRILNRERGNSAAFARNRGAEVAKGKILVFLDADTYINKKFLEGIDESKEKVDGYITVNLPFRGNLISKILSGFLGPSKKARMRGGKVYGLENCEDAGKMFFVITRKAFDKIGGYSEKTFYYEDELFADKFYKQGFKSTLIKKSRQYFELPSTFTEFLRQCKWLGKGTNSIRNKSKKRRHKLIWFVKAIFSIFPFFFILNPFIFWSLIFFSLVISYLGIFLRNKKPLVSLMALPFFYLKNILVAWNIIRFWK